MNRLLDHFPFLLVAYWGPAWNLDPTVTNMIFSHFSGLKLLIRAVQSYTAFGSLSTNSTLFPNANVNLCVKRKMDTTTTTFFLLFLLIYFSQRSQQHQEKTLLLRGAAINFYIYRIHTEHRLQSQNVVLFGFNKPQPGPPSSSKPGPPTSSERAALSFVTAFSQVSSFKNI